jgi:hypothetical protein
MCEALLGREAMVRIRLLVARRMMGCVRETKLGEKRPTHTAEVWMAVAMDEGCGMKEVRSAVRFS